LNWLISGLELWQWRNRAIKAAIASNVPITEVDWLLQDVANLDKLTLRLNSFKERNQIQVSLSLDDLDRLWQKRLNEKLPIQYICGYAPWREFRLQVSPAVLIPRPETEYLIDLAVLASTRSKIKDVLQQGYWADLGTGSGAIALGLATALPDIKIHAVDVSPDAVMVAQTNAANLDLVQRINFQQGSWWEPLVGLAGQFSGMVSNPPYIPTNILPSLQPEVFRHEPHLALDGGVDGLDSIRSLVELSPNYLHSGGVWLIETMMGQTESVVKMLDENGQYENIEIYADLAGISRFVMADRI